MEEFVGQINHNHSRRISKILIFDGGGNKPKPFKPFNSANQQRTSFIIQKLKNLKNIGNSADKIKLMKTFTLLFTSCYTITQRVYANFGIIYLILIVD